MDKQYQKRLIMLQGTNGQTGFVNLEAQDGRLTLKFQAVGLNRGATGAHGSLISVTKKRVIDLGAINVDNRGQGGLLKTLESSELQGIALGDWDTVAVVNGDEPILTGSITASRADADTIRSVIAGKKDAPPKKTSKISEKKNELFGLFDKHKLTPEHSESKTKTETKFEPRTETKLEPKTETKPEPKFESRFESKFEPKTETTRVETVLQAKPSQGKPLTETKHTEHTHTEPIHTESLLKEKYVAEPRPAKTESFEKLDKPREYVSESGGEWPKWGAYRRPALLWPEELSDLRNLYERGEKYDGVKLPGWTFVKTPSPSLPFESLLGVFDEDGKVTRTALLLTGSQGAEPPAGLVGYTYESALAGGCWVKWQEHG